MDSELGWWLSYEAAQAPTRCLAGILCVYLSRRANSERTLHYLKYVGNEKKSVLSFVYACPLVFKMALAVGVMEVWWMVQEGEDWRPCNAKHIRKYLKYFFESTMIIKSFLFLMFKIIPSFPRNWLFCHYHFSVFPDSIPLSHPPPPHTHTHWQLVVYACITPSKYVKLIMQLIYWLGKSLSNTYSVSGTAEDIRDKMMSLMQTTDRLLGESQKWINICRAGWWVLGLKCACRTGI